MRPIVHSPYSPDLNTYPMVTLTTRSGRQITMTAESLFGLHKAGGQPVVHTNRLFPSLKPMRFDFKQDVPFWDQDPRYWYIAGFFTAAGDIPPHPTHAACARVQPDRVWELTLLKEFLDAYFDTFEKDSFIGRYPITEIRNSAISSKMVNMIVNRIGTVQEDRKDKGTFGTLLLGGVNDDSLSFLNNMHGISAYAGFMAGILAGGTVIGPGRVIMHRNSRFLRALNHYLFVHFGIPSETDINPHEDPVLFYRTAGFNVHQLGIRRGDYLKIMDAGLAHWDEDYINHGGPQSPLDRYYDAITEIRPAGILPGIELEVDDNGVIHWGGFSFDPEFEVDARALDIATMEELFVDVVNPQKVLADDAV